MQQNPQEPYKEYTQLFDTAEKEWIQACNELEEAKIRNQKAKAEYEKSMQKKHSLKLQKLQLLEQINAAKDRRITESNILLKRATEKGEELEVTEKLAKQEPSSIQMPSVSIQLAEMSKLKQLEDVINEYSQDFQEEKAILEQDIVRLRIVIKLNEELVRESAPKGTTGNRSQKSNSSQLKKR